MKLVRLFTYYFAKPLRYLLVLSLFLSFTIKAQDSKTDIEEEEEDYYNDDDETEVITLEDQKIKIEPVNPTLTLSRRYIKPKDFLFFRSFEDEVKEVPDDILDIDLDRSEIKIKNYKDLINRKRK